MRRFRLLVVGVLVLGALVPAVALAASSPTVADRPATHVADRLGAADGLGQPERGRRPATRSLGTSSALGASTADQARGHGHKAVAVKQYARQSDAGHDVLLPARRAEHQGRRRWRDPQVQDDGPAAARRRHRHRDERRLETATINGTIDTNGAATTWQVQYGPSTSYSSQTPIQTAANSASPVPVSIGLSGLAPLTLFHYRLVAFHAGKFDGAGADATFFTKPSKPLAPNLRTKHLTQARQARRRSSSRPTGR